MFGGGGLAQRAARRSKLPLDEMRLYTEVTGVADAERLPEDPPEEGAFVHGLLLEGASWHAERAMLADAVGPQRLPLPVVHLHAVERAQLPTHPVRGAPAAPLPPTRRGRIYCERDTYRGGYLGSVRSTPPHPCGRSARGRHSPN